MFIVDSNVGKPPTVTANKNVLLTTEVRENYTPLLLSEEAMKKIKTYIDFSKDKIIIFDEEVTVQFSQDITVYYSWKNE